MIVSSCAAAKEKPITTSPRLVGLKPNYRIIRSDFHTDRPRAMIPTETIIARAVLSILGS